MKLIKDVVSSGHHSVLEHFVLTFGIDGVSRTLTHQLVRHRLASYSQQSQRYVKEKQFDFVTPSAVKRNPLMDERYNEFMSITQQFYSELIEQGIDPEDARFVLPGAACTNIVMTLNARELIHISTERLCTRAQWEVRQLFWEIKEQLEIYVPWLADLLVPKCDNLGYCPEPESRCCGRYSVRKQG